MAIQAAGYLGAAIIAASAAFAGLIIGKEQKTTEFRQDWINAQRRDIAVLLASAKRAARQPNKVREERKTFDLAYGRILLRENPDRPEWPMVLDEIGRLSLYAFDMPVPSNVESGCERIIQQSRRLLKDEWNRVRAGEMSFRILRAVLPLALGVAAAALAYGKGFVVIG